MTEDLEAIKTDPQILRLYGQRVSKLKKEADRYVGVCPLHSEKTASFTIFKDLRWTCFGGCGSGDCFTLVQKMDNCDFKTAVSKVKEFLGGSTWESQRTAVESVFKPVADTTKEYKVFKLSDYEKYDRNLKNSKPAQDWLASRGITLETALRLRCGFVQDVGGKAGTQNADIAGKGWVSFPTVSGGTVTSIKYRSIVRKAFCKQGGMATELFNTEGIDVFEDVLLCEGEVDCLTLEQAGFRAVSLASASSHPTPPQKDLLMKANRVFLAGDADGGVGEAIMAKLWRELQERTYLLRWPEGMKDANQTFLEHCKGDVSIFRTLVEGLVQSAASMPMPDVYDLKEVMTSSTQGNLSEHPDRFRFPQPDVDHMAILMPGSVLGVFSTNTSMGKTQFVIQATLHNAMKYGRGVLSYQCELTPEEVATIVTAQILKKSRNSLTNEDKKQAAEMLGDVQYYVGHNPNVSDGNAVLDLIEAAIKRLSVDIIVIDTYHNLVLSENNSTAIETALSNRIKNMAMKYKKVIVVIFQPRKASQQTKGKKTHITDIRGAGAAADTCDAVMAIHRDLAKSDDDSPADDIYESRTLIQAQKTRSKGTGKSETYLMFFGQYATFEQLDYTHEEPQ